MSWLTDFTSKAETLLNKIDQSAASTFHNESNLDLEVTDGSIVDLQTEKTRTLSFDRGHAFKDIEIKTSPTTLKPRVDAFAEIKMDRLPAEKPFQPSIKHSASTSSLKKQDEMLFEFLNSSSPAGMPTKGHTRNLSGEPITMTLPQKTLSRKSSSTENLTRVQRNVVVPRPSEEWLDTGVAAGKGDSIPSSSLETSGDSSLQVVTDDRISNLELENKLLKNEMQLLNNELATNLKRLKEQQDEAEGYKKRYENRRNQQNDDYERIFSDYESRTADLNEALRAKDSQLAVLRVRLQETDACFKEKEKTLEEVQLQNERLLKDHSDASGVHGDAMQQLQSKLEELESALKKEKREHGEIKNELMNMQSKYESSQLQSSSLIMELQTKNTQEREKLHVFEQKVKSEEGSANLVHKEFADYKDKAARILQAKEKLITSLKQGCSGTDVQPMLYSELDSLRQERDLLRDELQQSKFDVEQLKSEYQDLEMLHHNEVEQNNERFEGFQSTLQDEIQKRQHAEEDMKRLMQELQFTRDDMHKSKKTQIALNQKNEQEITSLRNQVASKKSVASSHEELENRLRSLTESLIQKQTTIEALSTEKNSLVLQLERLEKQYIEVQNSLVLRNKATQQNDDVEGSHIPRMSSVMPSQIVQNRRWKSTVNQIDKVSIQLGVFLRRYPAARLLVLVYMLLLHMWVTFVLLTYTPEIHPPDHA